MGWAVEQTAKSLALIGPRWLHLHPTVDHRLPVTANSKHPRWAEASCSLVYLEAVFTVSDNFAYTDVICLDSLSLHAGYSACSPDTQTSQLWGGCLFVFFSHLNISEIRWQARRWDSLQFLKIRKLAVFSFRAAE